MMNKLKTSAAIATLVTLGACGIFKGGDKHTPVLGDRVPILASETEINVDETIADVPVTVPAPRANDAWTQPGGDAAKAMGALALPDQLSRAWSIRVPGGSKRSHFAAAPVVAGGRLYVMDTNGAVHAVDAQSGATVWTKQTAPGEENANARFGGGVSFDGGHVFATNGLGEVVALDAATGDEIWRAKPGGPLRGAPTLANNNVYVLSQDNQLFALSQSDGKVQWTQSASLESQGVFGVAAPASARGTVVAGFSSGELNAYRYENGRSLWGDVLSRTRISTSVSSLDDIDADPVIDGDRAYAVGQGGRMVALDLLSGQRLWEQNIAGIATPWVAGDWIYLVTTDAKLLAIARDSGKIRWVSQLRAYGDPDDKEDPIDWYGPVLAGGRLVLVSSDGEITNVAPADGTVQASVDTGYDFSLPPVVANNMLYVLANNGTLTAYR
ncbi:PQQ-binding-like beta-propeller repeat protein [Stakelama saccharophila]|uniref:PQQ-binding-like beta-propeller repeat protein n=1 Tax=Stakelama saccharophila TaxID=3075605 RepID=A0ABZ0BDC8_9SPHN|nr:PQQ-binding-like beta-propeller repeat protein [Stakelama sp. W311]WNO54893.1 PQQ-binding-like beta-propeller repeat protein [Stakelama sp. W311]